MSEFHFGDIVQSDYGKFVKMVVCVNHKCTHHAPPCLVLAEVGALPNPDKLSGWCYSLRGSWKKLDEGR